MREFHVVRTYCRCGRLAFPQWVGVGYKMFSTLKGFKEVRQITVSTTLSIIIYICMSQNGRILLLFCKIVTQRTPSPKQCLQQTLTASRCGIKQRCHRIYCTMYSTHNLGQLQTTSLKIRPLHKIRCKVNSIVVQFRVSLLLPSQSSKWGPTSTTN